LKSIHVNEVLSITLVVEHIVLLLFTTHIHRIEVWVWYIHYPFTAQTTLVKDDGRPTLHVMLQTVPCLLLRNKAGSSEAVASFLAASRMEREFSRRTHLKGDMWWTSNCTPYMKQALHSSEAYDKKLNV